MYGISDNSDLRGGKCKNAVFYILRNRNLTEIKRQYIDPFVSFTLLVLLIKSTNEGGFTTWHVEAS